MGLKKLKEYDVTFKELKVAVSELNNSELLEAKIKVVGIKGEDCMGLFLDAIDSIHKDDMPNVPESVQEFYNNLSDELLNDSKGGVRDGKKSKVTASKKTKKVKEDEVDPTEGIESECPVFGKGWDDSEEDCQECKTDFPKEYEACKTVCTKAKEDKGAKKDKIKTSRKQKGKRSRYGQMPKSQVAFVDDMLWEGNTVKDMVAFLVKTFKRDEKVASGRVTSHIARLVKEGIITLEKRDDDIQKAANEFAEGFNADNTIDANAS